MKTMKAKNKGFTLVELIVVLVILAILAAILIPALLGFIDRAREKKDINMAKAYLDASQAMLADLYGKSPNTDNGCVIPESSPAVKVDSGTKGDVDARNSKFAKRVFDLVSADKEPYVFMFACGNAKTASLKTEEHDKYTVYYALYMRDENSVPLYFYDGTWTKVNPSLDSLSKKSIDNNKNNKYVYNGKTLYLQYYILGKAGNKTVGNYWTWLKNDVAKRWK